MPVLNIVKGRRVGSSVVLTAPRESENVYYSFSVADDGRITYTPFRRQHAAEHNHSLGDYE